MKEKEMGNLKGECQQKSCNERRRNGIKRKKLQKIILRTTYFKITDYEKTSPKIKRESQSYNKLKTFNGLLDEDKKMATGI